MKTILFGLIISCMALCFNTVGQSNPSQPMSFSAEDTIGKTVEQIKVGTSATSSGGAFSVLSQDSGKNFSDMNYTLFSAVDEFGLAGMGIGEVVRFNATKPGWKLKGVQILGWSGFNNTTKQFPAERTFLIEIRDSVGDLLYRFIDIQNVYFSSATGPVIHNFEIPALPVTERFFVVFYDRGSLGLGMELANATGNSFFIVKGRLIPVEFKDSKTNETYKVNWLVRAIGE